MDLKDMKSSPHLTPVKDLVYCGEFVKKSTRHARRYVSGRLNSVFRTYTLDSSSGRNLFGYNSYT
jgi:hypothetical protein